MKAFKEIISTVENALKPKGWLKRANTFYINKDNNWGLVDFQKSKSSSSEKILFTINLGVSSTAIREFNNDDLSQKPVIENCHWRRRIGFILPQKQDYWLELDNNTVLKDIAVEIINMINDVAIPEINRHVADRNLEALWLGGISEGLTRFERFICLTVLLKKDNKKNIYDVINELRGYSQGKPYEAAAKMHIRLLGFD